MRGGIEGGIGNAEGGKEEEGEMGGLGDQDCVLRPAHAPSVLELVERRLELWCVFIDRAEIHGLVAHDQRQAINVRLLFKGLGFFRDRYNLLKLHIKRLSPAFLLTNC